MEIISSPFAWSDQIYKQVRGFTINVARLANYLDQVTNSESKSDSESDSELSEEEEVLYARLQTGRIMVWWCLSVRPSGSPSVSHSFPHFSLLCFDVLSWNLACHFLVMNIRSSSSVLNFRQVL